MTDKRRETSTDLFGVVTSSITDWLNSTIIPDAGNDHWETE
jgi:hypothetical protein